MKYLMRMPVCFALVLIPLWAESHFYSDQCSITVGRYDLDLNSAEGELRVGLTRHRRIAVWPPNIEGHHWPGPSPGGWPLESWTIQHDGSWKSDWSECGTIFPHWLAISSLLALPAYRLLRNCYRPIAEAAGGFPVKP